MRQANLNGSRRGLRLDQAGSAARPAHRQCRWCPSCAASVGSPKGGPASKTSRKESQEMSIARRLQSVTAGVTLLLLFVSVSDSLSRDRRSKDLDSARRGPADGNSSLDGDRVPHATTPAEAYVLRQIAVGGAADLEEQFPKNADERVLGGPFLVDILTITSKLYRVHPHGIQISHAVVKEKLDLINREIPYDVKLLNCQFEHCIDFTWSRFHKSLN